MIISELKVGAEMAHSPDISQKRLVALARLKKKPLLWIDETIGEIFCNIAAHIQKNGRQHH